MPSAAQLTTLISRLWTDEEYQRLWLTHLATSLVIVVAYHFWCHRAKKDDSPTSSSRRRPQNRLVLSKGNLPDDLILREETPTLPTARRDARDATDSSSNRKRNPQPATKKAQRFTEGVNSDQDRRLESAVTSVTDQREQSSKSPRLRSLADQTSPKVTPPPFLSVPSNLEGFWHWCDTETSLFRIYTIATRSSPDDSFAAIPPYNPSSRRGTVRVQLQVTNQLPSAVVDVMWIDYKGRQIPKGTIRPRQTWHQTTWIDHPWVFLHAGDVLLHYVPYRIIPTTNHADTMDVEQDSNVGLHRFALRPAAASIDSTEQACSVHDPILPFPAQNHLTTRPLALEWALHHALRMQFDDWDLLLQYSRNLLLLDNSNNEKCRSIRLANPNFGPRLWQTPAQGILRALGFRENGGYAQIGNPWGMEASLQENLPRFVQCIEEWQHRAETEQETLIQPQGADGFGRAGFGRAGAINNDPL